LLSLCRWGIHLSRAYFFSVCHKVSLNGTEKSHDHSSYGILRYFMIYITSNNILPPLGAIIFFEYHTRQFFNTSGGLVEESISVGFSTITNKNTL
jgi:hypothetical protein